MLFARKKGLQRPLDVFPKRLVLDALNSVSEGFAFYDEQTRIVLWNQKFFEIFPSIQDLVERGETLRELLKEATRSGDIVVPAGTPEDWINRLIHDREKETYTFEYQLSDGRWMRSKSHKISSGGTVVVFRDVSDTKSREEILLNSRHMADVANRTKSAFLAHVSHELRTPLNAIMGFSEIMDKEMFGPLENEHYKEYVQNILKSAQHLLGVIDDILHVSKAEVGQLDLRETAVCLEDLADEVIRLMAPRAEAGGIHLKSDVTPQLPPFLGDERKIRQILINLLTNAIKFTPERGEVSLRMIDEKGLNLSVTDSGRGMREEDIPLAFEAFSQFESTFSRQHGGVGLGLHLTETFVKLHGGSIQIQSQINCGTTISIQFPASRWMVGSR